MASEGQPPSAQARNASKGLERLATCLVPITPRRCQMKPVGKPVHLTDDEVRSIQNEFKARRRPGSYEEGKWAVSHFNRDPRVLGAPWPNNYPKSVVLRDITLRTIEQTPGVTLSQEQRKRLAEALVDAGVSAVEIRAHG